MMISSSRRRRLAALLALSALLVAALPAAAADKPARDLAFVRGTPERSEIYVAREDGTGLRRLTSNRASDFSVTLTRTADSVDRLGDDTMPDWSPLGASIVFVSNRNGRRFSPDGARIAFTRLPPVAAPSVWIVNADGSGAHGITAGSEPDWRP